MAASTITRATWTNDSGTPAVPVGDGTVLNNTRLQNDIYAKIDEMFAGAGSYATFSLGGKFAVEGFGTSTFSAGGTGANAVKVRNTTAGTGNYALLSIGNDVDPDAFWIRMHASTFTTSGVYSQAGVTLQSWYAGGMNLVCSDASGVIKLYTGGTTERARLTAAGMLLLNDTTNADMTVGLTLNQGANNDDILCFKSSAVAHGLGGEETDTFASFAKASPTLGGLLIEAYSEPTGTTISTFEFFAEAATGSGDTTKSAVANGYFSMRAYENAAAIGANENVLVIRNANATTHIFDAEGDSHQDVGTAWTNFDDHEDAELLTALSAGVSRKGDPLRRAFGSLLKKHKATLERNRIVTFNKDGHHFVNWSRLNMLKVGAIRQSAARIAALERRLLALEGA